MTSVLKPVVAGAVTLPVLKLDAPISFWGGMDMETGRILDRNHPQVGALVGGMCLVVPNIRGSGGTPGNLATSLKLGVGPAAVVVGYPDVNVMAGVVVAQHLYGVVCPMFVAETAQLDAFETGRTARIEADGSFRVD